VKTFILKSATNIPMKKLLLLVGLIFLINTSSSLAKQDEPYYSKKFCVDLFSGIPEDPIKEKGKTIARIDCATTIKAMEFGWGDKGVFNNIGQSLYYSSKTGKLPSIVLLISEDMKKEDIRKSISKIEDINKAFEIDIEIILLQIPEGEIINKEDLK